MNDLMKELMAEAQRVNALEIEVNKTAKAQWDAVRDSRLEKFKKIADFLYECDTLLIEADALNTEKKNNFSVAVGSCTEPDGYHRTIEAVFWTNDVYIGGLYIGSGSVGSQQSISATIKYKKLRLYENSVIDGWNEGTEISVMNAVSKHVKKTLAKRVEKATANLKESNEKYEKYFGKEE